MSDLHIIIAPHIDDEVIGCYEVLITKNPIIVYTEDMPDERKQEAYELNKYVKIKEQYFLSKIPSSVLHHDSIFYFPDPYFEHHPSHRQIGAVGETLARKGFNIIFYTTNMVAPYIREVLDPKGKEDLLNNVYKTQVDLWKYEKKYILFEGYNKWIFK